MSVESPVEKIKERLSIVDVVSSYLRIEKAGTNFKAKCPFHNEKTPSFFISPSRDTFHCFGCNKGGDIFTFVEELEGVDFRGALKILADKAGVSLEERGMLKDEKDTLHLILEEATLYFQINLTQEKEALRYLYGRGLEATTLKSFRVGFAHPSWDALHAHLAKKGYTSSDMEKVGLVIKGERGYYDRFRSRIMFPIFDSAGRTVGFSGRVFGGDETEAKYVNTPETELYHKSRVLFGFDKAKQSIRKEDTAVVVEGQMDLIMSHQAGITHAVAVSGTALTGDHLRTLSRIAHTLILSFDADSAGLRAAERSAKDALLMGVDVKVARMKTGKDPADVIKEDKESFLQALRESVHIIHFYLDHLDEKKIDAREKLREAHTHVLPLLRSIGNKIDQSYFVKIVAERLGVSVSAIEEELRKVVIDLPEEVTPQETTNVHPQEARTHGVILWLESMDTLQEKTKEIIKKAKQILSDAGLNFETLPTQEKEKLIFEAERLETEERAYEELLDMMRHLNLRILKRRLDEQLLELRKAEKDKDEEKIKTILKTCDTLRKQIATHQ